MPVNSKRKKAAIEREKKKKALRDLLDPLSWTFEDPWNSGYIRTSAIDGSSEAIEIQQPATETHRISNTISSPNQVISELDELEIALPTTGFESDTRYNPMPINDLVDDLHYDPCPSDFDSDSGSEPDLEENDLMNVDLYPPMFTSTGSETNPGSPNTSTPASESTIPGTSSITICASEPKTVTPDQEFDKVQMLSVLTDETEKGRTLIQPVDRSDGYCNSSDDGRQFSTEKASCPLSTSDEMNKSTNSKSDYCTVSLPAMHYLNDTPSDNISYQQTNSNDPEEDPSELRETSSFVNVFDATHQCFPRDSESPSPRLPTEQHQSKSRSIHLSRSKTTIIHVPGVPAGKMIDAKQDCYCTACMKWSEYNASSHNDPVDAEMDYDSPEAKEMKRIYQSLDRVKPKIRFINRTGYFVPTRTHNKSKPIKKVIRKRLQAIDANEYAKVEVSPSGQIHGRRIVDYEFLVNWLTMAQAVHSQRCVGLLCPYQEDFQSMVSTLYLKCNVCNQMVRGQSEKPETKQCLRLSTVWAVLCSGGTYTLAHEFSSILNMPFMSRNTFIKDEVAMDCVLEAALDESLDKAIAGEKVAVLKELEEQNVTIVDGEPIKSCAALDGSWGQRSNGHRYNSASGCAAVIGTRTKKVCFIGCRNKRCTACNLNTQRSKNHQKPKKHKCYRNYKGASGGMEPDIIIDGFEKLLKKGIKFTTVIMDGDSTTVAKLKNNCKYGHEIRQQLCCNHAIKSLGKKLRELKCPKQFSDTMSKSIDRTTRGIRSAIKHCAVNTNGKDTEGLRQDIRNAPFHAFDMHSDCRPYFCSKKDEANDTRSIIPDLQAIGIWDKILVAIEKLAAKAEFLSENQTSNLVENLFCRLSKYNVGKRVDTMSRGSYQRRVYITALQHNDGYTWHDKYM